MAGIYLHIPFCKQACHYCDFHFSTNLAPKSQVVQAICHELQLREDYLKGETVQSIYFGGGTPSLLTNEEIDQLLSTIDNLYTVDKQAEITLEANPDDLTEEKLKALHKAGINRLSIGIQSFSEERLRYLNRAHTGSEAHHCILQAKAIGFDDITADLIYAIPPEDSALWESDLQQMLQYDLPHLSIYGLTIEEKTVFGRRAQRGQLREVDEEAAARQYEKGIQLLDQHGYEHYEISNFAQGGHYSRHNTAYWTGEKYLGVGPGAHSFDGQHRAANISHNQKYLTALAEDRVPLTIEQLTETERVNDYLLTHLRTKWGVNPDAFNHLFGRDFRTDCAKQMEEFVTSGLAYWDQNAFRLTSKGFLVADELSWRLFYEE